MITVETAEKIILEQLVEYGTEVVPFEEALGRVLAEDIVADRDLPPFNRVTMDGIAINYKAIEQGISQFIVKATQAAGDQPQKTERIDECIEIMTGAAISDSVDTIIRYEDIEIKENVARLVTTDEIKQRQNIHKKGADKKEGDIVAAKGQLITPAIISLAASVGKSQLLVKRLPKVLIISSGDELVDVNEKPSPYQIRKSNSYTVKAALKQHCLSADLRHIPDDPDITKQQIQTALDNYDVILLCGGISMGKFDYVPQALQDASVKKLFHKVEQRPGKPFWFGRHDNRTLVFAFPGNPVATFLCLHRYFLPWLYASLGISKRLFSYAALSQDFTFKPALKYFLQAKLNVNEDGQLTAAPVEGNGSGDFANLADTDAFIELPIDRSEFKRGDVFKIWPFSQIV